MSYDPLDPIELSEFVKLANAAGLDILGEDIPQLIRRNLLKPLKIDGKEFFAPAHLYVLAAYFDSVRVVRHPWTMRSSDRSMDDVKKTANVVQNILDALRVGDVDAEMATDLGELVIEIERYLMTIDPFGPLSSLIDFVHPEIRRQLRGTGRLTAELRAIATSLANAVDVDAVEESPPMTQEVAGDSEDDLRSTVSMDINTTTEASAVNRADLASPPAMRHPRPVTTKKPPIKTLPSIKTPDLPKKEESPAEPEEDAVEASDVAAAEAKPSPPPKPGADKKQPATEPENEDAGEPEAQEASEDAADDTAEAEAQEQSEAEVTDTSEPKAEPAPEPEPEPETEAEPEPEAEPQPEPEPEPEPEVEPEAETDDFDEDSAVAPTAIIAAPKPPPSAPKNDGGFSREKTSRTKSLMARLSEIRTKDASSAKTAEEGEELAKQISELNRQREQFFKEQKWQELADLYEERIDLFETPDECQQIYFALATIYEAKLKNPRRAFENYIFAFEASENNRERALEGIQRLGRLPDMQNSFNSWLEDQSSRSLEAGMKTKIQAEIARELAQSGEHHRAFLTLAATLLNDPERIDAEVLNQLEDMTLHIGEDDLDSFFSDLLEEELSPETQELVAIRAANSHLSRNQTLHAIRFFRLALEANPDNELAFANLSRLYQAEENWSDLAELAWNRYDTAPSPQGLASLRKAVEGEVGDDQAQVAHYTSKFESEPNNRAALEAVVAAHEATDKAAEVYGLLNRLLEHVTEPEQRAAALIHLAQVAIDHLHAPEEAQVHLERALEAQGPSVPVLQGLAKVHMATRDFMNAVSSLESLMNLELPAEERVEWLALGVEAATKAHRGEERQRFADELERINPHHSALKA